MKWTYLQSPRANILLGPNVGPDANIYAVATQGLGVFSLTPQGQLRWHIPEAYNRPPIDYQQVVFGPNGSANQLYFHANDHLSGVDLGGNRKFTYVDGLSTTNGDLQPVVAPGGTAYTTLFPAQLGAFDPNGNLLRTFFPTGVNDPPLNTVSAPEVGPDGVVYIAQNLSQLFAFNPNATQRWALNDNTIFDYVNVNTQNTVVFIGGRITYGQPGFFEGVSTGGSALWRVNLPTENGGTIVPFTRARFAGDGLTAYAATSILGSSLDPYSYLYAIDTSSGVVPTPTPTVAPTATPGLDTVTITQAVYTVSKQQLRVAATSTHASATLSVYVTATGQFIGTLRNSGGKYSGQFKWPTNPQNITVKSSLGGSSSATVTVK